ncbi:MAG TPA: hypothetical protein VK712_02285 [Verrucomicrobiae bacterium]|nr:hypothetical protein [Verrucomicrobiae bacterium]
MKQLNDELCDDEAAEAEIKEMIYLQLDDDTFDCFKDVRVTLNGEPVDFFDLLKPRDTY